MCLFLVPLLCSALPHFPPWSELSTGGGEQGEDGLGTRSCPLGQCVGMPGGGAPGGETMGSCLFCSRDRMGWPELAQQQDQDGFNLHVNVASASAVIFIAQVELPGKASIQPQEGTQLLLALGAASPPALGKP